MVKTAFRTHQLAFAALQYGSAVDAILPVVEFLSLRLGNLEFFYLLGLVRLVHGEIYGFVRPQSRKRYQANLSNPIPTALTAQTILNGSLSVVVAGISIEE